jgi:RHS repeat-associated protein
MDDNTIMNSTDSTRFTAAKNATIWDPRADMDDDGDVDAADQTAYDAKWEDWFSGLVGEDEWVTPSVTVSQAFSDVGNPYMFQGVPHFALDTAASATSGKLMLNHHRARFEDVAIGRWVTRDPRGYVDGMNLYQYSSSNAVNWIDPTGTACKVGCGPHECGCGGSSETVASSHLGGGEGTTTLPTSPPTSAPAAPPPSTGTKPMVDGRSACEEAKGRIDLDAGMLGALRRAIPERCKQGDILGKVPEVTCCASTQMEKGKFWCKTESKGITCCGDFPAEALIHEMIHVWDARCGADPIPSSDGGVTAACREIRAWSCSGQTYRPPMTVDAMLMNGCTDSMVKYCKQPTRPCGPYTTQAELEAKAKALCARAASDPFCRVCPAVPGWPDF